MSFDVDVELDGFGTTLTALEELQERWDGPVEILVFSRAPYSRPLEFGRGPIEPKNAEALRFEIDGEVVYAARVSGHPPYPFFRPAVREFQAGPERFLRKHGYDLGGFDSLREFMRAVGSALETQMKQNATAQRGSGRSPGTHPSHPRVESGNLRAGIGYVMLGV